MTVVSNTSPLCYLAWIDHLGILPSMMSELDIQIEDYGSRWQISLLLDGKAVSGAGVVKKRMQIGSVTVRMGGIAGVWTDADHRLKGYGSQAMRVALDLMDRKGYETSILFGIADFYHRYGYAVVFPSSGMSVQTEALLQARSDNRVRACRQADLSAIRRIYRRYNAGRSGMAVRGGDWKPAWRLPGMGEGTVRRPGKVLVVEDSAGRVKGYAAYDGQAGQFHVSEIGGYDGRTFGSLANALARRARRSGAESVRFHLPPNDAFGAFCIRYGCAWSIWYPSNAGSMGRIVQLGPLIEKLQPEFSRRLHRAGADWKGMLAIETDIGSVGLRIDGSNVVATQETQASTLNVRVPQMLLTQLVLGYRDVVEVACDTGVQLPVRSVPIMAALFPKGHPFMWWSDRF